MSGGSRDQRTPGPKWPSCADKKSANLLRGVTHTLRRSRAGNRILFNTPTQPGKPPGPIPSLEYPPGYWARVFYQGIGRAARPWPQFVAFFFFPTAISGRAFWAEYAPLNHKNTTSHPSTPQAGLDLNAPYGVLRVSLGKGMNHRGRSNGAAPAWG